MNKHERRNACRRFNSLFVFGFLLLVLFNILQPVQEYSELENRYLQKFPEFNLKTVLSGQFMEDFEKYVNDHFVFRNELIKLKANTEYLTGKKENNGVFICSNGYFMEKPPQYDEDLLNKNIAAIKTLNDTGRYNISVTVIPPAYEVLSDYLPQNAHRDTILKLNTTLQTSFQNTDIRYSDPTAMLKQFKEDYLYYRTDHHLTTHGAYVAYHNLSGILNFTPLKGSDFKISDVTREFMGTTYSKALRKTEPDVITDYRPLETPRFKVRFPYDGTEADSMYFPAHLKEKDKYSYFLDGNHALTVIESPNKNGRHLAVFKDSYAHNIVPFLANHFETIHMIDLRYYNDDVIRYMSNNDISEVLFLYSSATFMSDTSIQKISAYAKGSSALLQKSGRVASSKAVDNGYFANTAFVGDSLTDAFQVYANLPDATFLCGTSMTIQGLSSRPAPGGGTIMDRIKQGGFSNVYIMLGTNEYLTPGNRNKIIGRYAELIDTVKEHNPDAKIFIQSILPVAESAQIANELENKEIRNYNEALLKLAEEKGVYYLDIYSAFANENGHLPDYACTDGTHLTKEYYLKWLDYLKTHTVGVNQSAVPLAIDEEIQSEIDVKALAKTALDSVTVKDALSETSRFVFYSTYGLDESKLANAAGYRGSGATADEIVVFEVKNERDVGYVREKAEAYIESRKNSFRNYIPEEMPKLENPFIFVRGKAVVVCIAEDYGSAEEKIKTFLR